MYVSSYFVTCASSILANDQSVVRPSSEPQTKYLKFERGLFVFMLIRCDLRDWYY